MATSALAIYRSDLECVNFERGLDLLTESLVPEGLSIHAFRGERFHQIVIEKPQRRL
jgi:hypothetical protein